jgi:hypothetical protein
MLYELQLQWKEIKNKKNSVLKTGHFLCQIMSRKKLLQIQETGHTIVPNLQIGWVRQIWNPGRTKSRKLTTLCPVSKWARGNPYKPCPRSQRRPPEVPETRHTAVLSFKVTWVRQISNTVSLPQVQESEHTVVPNLQVRWAWQISNPVRTMVGPESWADHSAQSQNGQGGTPTSLAPDLKEDPRRSRKLFIEHVLRWVWLTNHCLWRYQVMN